MERGENKTINVEFYIFVKYLVKFGKKYPHNVQEGQRTKYM